MKRLEDIEAIYFIGIGGIGMSALARYFLTNGKVVGGYDSTPSKLTEALICEGAVIHYDDDVTLIPKDFLSVEDTLVVYTPAIPSCHKELSYFRDHNFNFYKRAQILGMLTRIYKGLCVAGTHGKTTVTAMTAHVLQDSHIGCNAFLGGITRNYGTNYLLSKESPYVVIEADEFDRSFHQLRPFATVITAVDADHLDIYGTPQAYLESFEKYTSLIQKGGFLILNEKVDITPQIGKDITCMTYGRTKGDFHAENISIGKGEIVFDLISPFENIKGIKLGVPVSINIDNSIAAIALSQIAGATGEDIRKAMLSYNGVERRFDFYIKNEEQVLLSDYAHHPKEIEQSISSLKEVFNGRKILGIFQPHLYTRTRDFYKEFAKSLSVLDEVILTDIYPAREQPIKGITSQIIYEALPKEQRKEVCLKEDLLDLLKKRASTLDIVVVLGAGNIVSLMPEIKNIMLSVNKKY